MNYWDYHIHLENGPYTLDWLKSFLKPGLEEIGVSEHCHRFKQYYDIINSPGERGNWVKKEMILDIEDYINFIESAKKCGLPIKLGMELDYIPGKEMEIEKFIKTYPFDYVIGSIHWLDEWGFDNEDYIDGWNNDIYDIYKKYFTLLCKAAESRLFSFLGHIDVIKVFGYKPDKKIDDLYQNVIETIAKNKQIVEVSTAGLRKPVGEIYPCSDLMKLIKNYDIPVILDSDAHYPEQMLYKYDEAYDYIKSFGINKLAKFDKMMPQFIAV